MRGIRNPEGRHFKEQPRINCSVESGCTLKLGYWVVCSVKIKLYPYMK